MGAPRLKPKPSAALCSARAISEHPKGIHQGQVISGLCISIGAQQGKRVVSCLHQGLPEAADQGAIDVADEVAEVIDRNDDARDGA